MPGDPSQCHGSGPDHCCYQVVDGVERICPFLEMNTQPGRRFTCGLYREHSEAHPNWPRRKLADALHTDPRYLAEVKPIWERYGVVDCADYGPAEQNCCYAPETRASGWPDPVPADQISPRAKLPPPGRFDERG